MLELRIGSNPEHSSARSTSTAIRSSQEILTEFLSGAESRNLLPSERRELTALVREQDDELFHSELIHLAGRIENRDQIPLAARLYSLVQSQSQIPHLRSRAESRLALFEGGGSFGDRFEFHAQRFFDHSTDPVALASMAIGGAAFRVARLGLLGRLFSSGSANWATRGLGARVLANGGAFLAESTSFVLAGRGLNALSGRNQDWSFRSLGQEWAAGAITLASLRAFGAAGNGLYRRFHGSAASPWQTLYAQSAMFGGILLAHQTETRLGLRQPTQGSNALIDGFVTLLQFNVAGRILHEGLGPRWRAWENGLDQRAENFSWRLSRPAGPTSGMGGFGPMPALAGNATFPTRQTPLRQVNGLVFMEGRSDGDSRPEAPSNGAGDSVQPATVEKPPSWWPTGRIGPETLREVFNTLPDTTVILEFVPGEPSEGLGGRIRMANDRVKEKFGYTPEETVDMPLSRFTRPEDAAMMARFQRMILSTGRIKFENVPFIRKDGSVIYCDVRGNAQKLGDRTIGFAILQDVSKRRAAQAQIQTERARFRALLKGVPDVIFRIGRDGTFLDAHAERPEVFVLPMEKVIGIRVWDLPVPPALLDLARRGIDDALSTGQTQYVEYNLPLPDGSFRVQEGRITASGADEVVATVRDVTEARQAENHRIAAARAELIKHFGEGLAHDANNVLTPLGLSLHLVLGQMKTSIRGGQSPSITQVENWISDIEDNNGLVGRLTSMIGGFRALSGEPVSGPPFDLHSVLEYSELRKLVGTEIPVLLRLSAMPWQVPGPKENIHRVILNLVVNARDAMAGRNGSLRIETTRVVLSTEDFRQLAGFSPGIVTRRGGNFMRLRIQDNGSGIAPENLSRIFEPFFSTKPKNDAGAHGGLGLALSQKIIQDAGGFITVESSPSGTVFDVYLPEAEVPSTNLSSPALTQARAKPILVVHPDAAFRESIQAALTNRGFTRILSAQSVEEAHQLIPPGEELGGLLTSFALPNNQYGMKLMDALRQRHPNLPSIVWSDKDPSFFSTRLGHFGAGVDPSTSPEQVGVVLEDLLTRPPPPRED